MRDAQTPPHWHPPEKANRSSLKLNLIRALQLLLSTLFLRDSTFSRKADRFLPLN
jgi:hypothetical protein